MKKRIGPYTACLYAILMLWAYASQVIILWRTKDVSNISVTFIAVALIAVFLRVATIGSAIREVWQRAEIRSVSSIALTLAELVVIVGLSTVLVQIFIYL